MNSAQIAAIRRAMDLVNTGASQAFKAKTMLETLPNIPEANRGTVLAKAAAVLGASDQYQQSANKYLEAAINDRDYPVEVVQ